MGVAVAMGVGVGVLKGVGMGVDGGGGCVGPVGGTDGIDARGPVDGGSVGTEDVEPAGGRAHLGHGDKLAAAVPDAL